MERCPTYLPPIHPRHASNMQEAKWDEAIQFYNAGQHDKVMTSIIEYVDANLLKYKSGNGYSIPHGSVVINIRQENDNLIIESPFINIKDAKRVPLMRKLAELRQHPLNLASISLKGNEAVFFFECPLNLCEPYKIYNVLREICVFADIYDDEFIEKFDATRLQEPEVEPLTQQLKEDAYRKFQQIINEGLDQHNYYMAKRDGNNAWYALNIALKRIEYCTQPQGFLRTEIERAIDDIFNRYISFHDRLLQGKAKLEYLQQYDKEKFVESLYRIQTFIPDKYNGKVENIRQNWGDAYEDVKNMMNNGSTENASMIMLSCIYDCYYYNALNEDIDKPLRNALAQANGLPWGQAASALFGGMQSVMEENLVAQDYGMDLTKAMGDNVASSMSMVQKMLKSMLG